MEDKDKFYSEDIINNLIEYYLDSYKEVAIIFCIGTPKSIGDSLGPLIGTRLSELNCEVPVYGTLDFPVHAINLDVRLYHIFKEHPNAFVIGIDAAVGDEYDIGKTKFRNFAVRPGKGVGKDLQPVGDVSVVGIVADCNKDEDDIYDDINLVSEDLINNMCDKIIQALYEFSSRITIAQQIAVTI
jgi:putative sporulation protein YyaC